VLSRSLNPQQTSWDERTRTGPKRLEADPGLELTAVCVEASEEGPCLGVPTRTVRDVCREYEIAETLYYQWRDRLLEGGKAALSTSRDRGKDPRDVELSEARKRVGELERALGRKTYELEIAGKLLRDWE